MRNFPEIRGGKWASAAASRGTKKKKKEIKDQKTPKMPDKQVKAEKNISLTA